MRVRRDPLVEEAIKELVAELRLNYIKPESIKAVRTINSKSTAYARVWGLSKVLQVGLGLSPAYVLEIIEDNFRRLSCVEKVNVLIHELAHIPKTFSGSVRPHNEYFSRDLRRLKAAVKGNYELINRVCIKLP